MVRDREIVIRVICVLLLLLLTGCAARGEGLEVSKSGAPAVKGSETIGSSEDEQLQSSEEKQLVIVFIALLEMDKKADLQITGKQAESILPVVNDTIAQGQLTQANRKLLIATLDLLQLSFYEEVSAQMRRRAAAMAHTMGNPARPMLSEEEQRTLAKDLEQRRSAELQQEEGKPIPPQWKGSGPTSDFPPDKNVEQQLVELLQSKLNLTLSNLN